MVIYVCFFGGARSLTFKQRSPYRVVNTLINTLEMGGIGRLAPFKQCPQLHIITHIALFASHLQILWISKDFISLFYMAVL